MNINTRLDKCHTSRSSDAPLWSALICILGVTAVTVISGCGPGPQESSDLLIASSANLPTAGPKQSGNTAVLLVSHGSQSVQWRKMLLDVEHDVSERVLAVPGIGGIKSAFMEYTEPSIATQLKALDDEGFTRVILVPLLLTVSSHSFDDIPTIIGAKDDATSIATLEAEGIERHKPRASVTITPLLDFSSLLETNLIRRISRQIKHPAQEGVVLVAYGDAQYDDEWVELFTEVGEKIKAETGVAMVTHSWCGHLVHYSTEPTVNAIQSVLEEHKRAIVVPVLVAYDEMFQGKIIGGAVHEVGGKERVIYTPDAILPEPALNDWIVSICESTSKASVPEATESQP